MANDSTSSKLQELFDLFKSGALTKEEYDLLKSQIISPGKDKPKTEKIEENIISSSQAEDTEEQLPQAESVIELPHQKEKIDDPSHNLTEDKINHPIEKGQEKNDIVRKPKINIYRIVIVASILLIIIVSIFINSRHNKEEQKDEVLNRSKTEAGVANKIAVKDPSIFDEAFATKIIMDELSKFPDWLNLANGDTATWHHKIISFNKLSLNGKDLMLALVSNKNDYQELLSIFEFEKSGVWKFGKKSIAFVNYSSENPNIISIARDNYGLLIQSEEKAMGGRVSMEKEIYSFINGEIKLIFAEEHKWQNPVGKPVFNIRFRTEADGYNTIETDDNETLDGSSGNSETLKTTTYKFNGKIYENNNSQTNTNDPVGVKRDPRAKDVANVFWNPEYTLFCKLTDEPIYPNSEGKYDIWISSREDPNPYHIVFTKEQLVDMKYYKFKDYETCKKWCDERKQIK